MSPKVLAGPEGSLYLMMFSDILKCVIILLVLPLIIFCCFCLNKIRSLILLLCKGMLGILMQSALASLMCACKSLRGSIIAEVWVFS